MTVQTMLIMVLLVTMNSGFGFYIYLRFGPKKLFMIPLPDEEYKKYNERLAPIGKLNSYGRKLTFYALVTIVVSLLILTELFRAL